MPQTLLDIERRILDYMVQYLRDNTYQPSIREIGERFGIKSTKTVSEHLQALADKGFLERDPSRSRGVRILGMDLHPDTVSLPCYGGFPSPHRGGASAEAYYTVDRQLGAQKGGFFVRARGTDAAVLGVEEGDLLLVEPVSIDEVEDGAIVATMTFDGTGALHRLGRNGTGPYLEALRPTTAGDPERIPLDLSKMDFVGQVSGLFRRFTPTGTPTSLRAH